MLVKIEPSRNKLGGREFIYKWNGQLVKTVVPPDDCIELPDELGKELIRQDPLTFWPVQEEVEEEVAEDDGTLVLNPKPSRKWKKKGS